MSKSKKACRTMNAKIESLKAEIADYERVEQKIMKIVRDNDRQGIYDMLLPIHYRESKKACAPTCSCGCGEEADCTCACCGMSLASGCDCPDDADECHQLTWTYRTT